MNIFHHFSSGVYVKETHFFAGESGEKHVHQFDHLSTLAAGIVRLQVDEEVSTITGPSVITVKAGKAHKVTALTDCVWLCIHATDCTDPEQIDHQILEG
jgi:quercetin dioxygenase-like cupin family protein